MAPEERHQNINKNRQRRAKKSRKRGDRSAPKDELVKKAKMRKNTVKWDSPGPTRRGEKQIEKRHRSAAPEKALSNHKKKKEERKRIPGQEKRKANLGGNSLFCP